ncbi:hypothetical protein [Aminobacter phage Erebus]|nr:hypothetical protein [Aminobacter phage Erebus]
MTKKPKQEKLELSTGAPKFRFPKPGDVINPAGDILVHDGKGGYAVKFGRVMLSYAKGIMATKYGWHVVDVNEQFMIVEKNY